jgi:hypothetical protein
MAVCLNVVHCLIINAPVDYHHLYPHHVNTNEKAIISAYSKITFVSSILEKTDYQLFCR